MKPGPARRADGREATKQFSFRLPKTLVDRVERCVRNVRASGLDLTRADVVRLLLNHALESTQCRLELLIVPPKKAGRNHKRA